MPTGSTPVNGPSKNTIPPRSDFQRYLDYLHNFNKEGKPTTPQTTRGPLDSERGVTHVQKDITLPEAKIELPEDALETALEEAATAQALEEAVDAADAVEAAKEMAKEEAAEEAAAAATDAAATEAAQNAAAAAAAAEEPTAEQVAEAEKNRPEGAKNFEEFKEHERKQAEEQKPAQTPAETAATEPASSPAAQPTPERRPTTAAEREAARDAAVGKKPLTPEEAENKEWDDKIRDAKAEHQEWDDKIQAARERNKPTAPSAETPASAATPSATTPPPKKPTTAAEREAARDAAVGKKPLTPEEAENKEWDDKIREARERNNQPAAPTEAPETPKHNEELGIAPPEQNENSPQDRRPTTAAEREAARDAAVGKKPQTPEEEEREWEQKEWDARIRAAKEANEPPAAQEDAADVNADKALAQGVNKQNEADKLNEENPDLVPSEAGRPIENGPGAAGETTPANDNGQPATTQPDQEQAVENEVKSKKERARLLQKKLEEKLSEVDGKAGELRASGAMQVVKRFLPGIYAKIMNAVSGAQNTSTQATIAILEIRIAKLKAAKHALETGKGVGSVFDAAKATIQAAAALWETILIPIVIALLFPFIVFVMAFFFFTVGGGTITSALDKILKQINELLQPLEELLAREKRKVDLRKRLSVVNNYLAGGAEEPEELGQSSKPQQTAATPLSTTPPTAANDNAIPNSASKEPPKLAA